MVSHPTKIAMFPVGAAANPGLLASMSILFDRVSVLLPFRVRGWKDTRESAWSFRHAPEPIETLFWETLAPMVADGVLVEFSQHARHLPHGVPSAPAWLKPYCDGVYCYGEARQAEYSVGFENYFAHICNEGLFVALSADEMRSDLVADLFGTPNALREPVGLTNLARSVLAKCVPDMEGQPNALAVLADNVLRLRQKLGEDPSTLSAFHEFSWFGIHTPYERGREGGRS